MRNTNRHYLAAERGQSMTEFALSLTALLFILVGVLDLGRLYMTYVALQNAAGEGALYAAIHPMWETTCTPGQFGCNTAYDNITARVKNESPSIAGGLINWNDARVTINRPGGNVEGQPIEVRVEYDYQLFTPILSRVWPQLTLTGTGVQLIMGH